MKIAAAIALAAALAAASFDDAHAALTAEKGSNFLVVHDDGTIAGTRWTDSVSVEATVRRIAGAYFGFVADDGELVVILTSFRADESFWFFGMENHVAGIGWRNEPDGQDFDYMPMSRLEGVIYLGETPYWATLPEHEFVTTALQEIGHRFCCYLRYDAGAGRKADLLGRAQNHWSYFAGTGGPMEGNRWRDNGDGTFTTANPEPPEGVYDDFALYTMGLIPAAEAAPVLVLDAPVTAGLMDSRGQPLSAGSPPQPAGMPLTVAATAKMVALADVVRDEGARSPAHPTKSIWRVGVVFVVRDGDDVAALTPMTEALVDKLFASFGPATRGKGQLINLTEYRSNRDGGADGGGGGGGEDCSCRMAARSKTGTPVLLVAMALGLLILRAIRLRRPLPR